MTTDGVASCWGYNRFGRLGDDQDGAVSTPVQVTALSTVTAIVAGRFHTCAVVTGGTPWCWGWNYYGQLGDGSMIDVGLSPVQVVGISDFG